VIRFGSELHILIDETNNAFPSLTLTP